MVMNTFTYSLTPLPKNPFSRSQFWGRQNAIRTIYRRLISTPPQCCALVGETFIGKTTLLRHLAQEPETTIIDDEGKAHTLTFVYFDCSISIDALDTELSEYVAAQFWWDLYLETCKRLQAVPSPDLEEPAINADKSNLKNYAYEVKSSLEGLILDHRTPIIFVFDNFEVIAHLHLRNSEWLRALVRSNCAYIVASRHLLYLLYQYSKENWNSPSPLQNLFSDPIYLGLMTEYEADEYLLQASHRAKELNSSWEQRDIDFIKFFCGRHPELIRIGCSHLFKLHLPLSQDGEAEENALESTFLEESIFNDARTVCSQYWNGLADPELRDEPPIESVSKEELARRLFPHQKVLLEIAKGLSPTDKDKKILFDLERRGLIEQDNGRWRVFAEVMCRFVLNKEAFYRQNVQAGENSQSDGSFLPLVGQQSVERKEIAAFTYLEGKVYDYLKSHVGEVCNRDDIKRAVWPNDPPTNTALQKIIERVRDKIEPDVNNPRYLIAIRGLGYMLREVPS
jgi:hypothetical protein